MLMVGKEATIN